MTSGSTRISVLVIDDDSMVRRFILRLLMRDHDVLDVDGGDAALAVLGAGRVFDVMVCDMEMPGMRGNDLHAIVLERHPLAAARMIFMTGGTLSRETMDFLNHPDRVVVWKPFNSEKLLETVARVAGRRSAPRPPIERT
jgi:CheY-like chemotaxis protein